MANKKYVTIHAFKRVEVGEWENKDLDLVGWDKMPFKEKLIWAKETADNEDEWDVATFYEGKHA